MTSEHPVRRLLFRKSRSQLNAVYAHLDETSEALPSPSQPQDAQRHSADKDPAAPAQRYAAAA